MVGKFHKKMKTQKMADFPPNILSVVFLIKSLNITINNVLADLGCKRRRIFSFIHWNWNFRFFLKIWLSPPTSLILRSTIFKIFVYFILLCCFFQSKMIILPSYIQKDEILRNLGVPPQGNCDRGKKAWESEG